MQKCAAAFVEVEPGNTAYGYRYHETVKKIFYIINTDSHPFIGLYLEKNK